MVKKNVMFVTNNPKHVILSVVIINKEFPLSDKEHEAIDNLNEVSDVVFLFTDTTNINPTKFSMLYNASGYVVSDNNVTSTFCYLVDYVKTIWNKHEKVVVISRFRDQLGELTKQYVSKFQAVYSLGFQDSIFLKDRLTAEDCFDIYKKDNNDEDDRAEESGWKIKLFGSKKNEDVEDIDKAYTTHFANSIVFINSDLLRAIINVFDEDKRFVQSFDSYEDPLPFLASLTEYKNTKVMNSVVGELNVSIYGSDLQTEGTKS